jgi:exosortase
LAGINSVPDTTESNAPQPSIRLEQSSLGSLSRQALLYIGWISVSCLLFLRPLIAFVRYSLSDENASHLVVIPFIAAWVIYLERERIFRRLGSDLRLASMLLAAGAAVALLALSIGSHWSAINRLSVYVFAIILFWAAGFAFLFGRQTLQRARFPFCFLLLTIPIPDFILDRIIYLLQKGSTEVAAVLFDWSGVPVLRDGFVFHLAHVNIEVARECSGIRSSLALLILAILVAYFYLRTFWKQVLLVVAGLFVMILKNGVRIVTLTLLASYVDPGFLYGRLHREGGVVFFLLGLLLLAPLVWLLQRGETPAPAGVVREAPQLPESPPAG